MQFYVLRFFCDNDSVCLLFSGVLWDGIRERVDLGDEIVGCVFGKSK
jgi:hypothetical protein